MKGGSWIADVISNRTDREKKKQQTNRETDKRASRPMDKLADKQTDRYTNGQGNQKYAPKRFAQSMRSGPKAAFKS
jgi:hypothetical protein